MIVYCLYADETADQGRAYADFDEFAAALRAQLEAERGAELVVEAREMAPIDVAALPAAQ